MSETFLFAAEIDEQIVTVEQNIRVLVDESASLSGILTHDLISQQIGELKAELNRLRDIRAKI